MHVVQSAAPAGTCDPTHVQIGGYKYQHDMTVQHRTDELTHLDAGDQLGQVGRLQAAAATLFLQSSLRIFTAHLLPTERSKGRGRRKIAHVGTKKSDLARFNGIAAASSSLPD